MRIMAYPRRHQREGVNSEQVHTIKPLTYGNSPRCHRPRLTSHPYHAVCFQGNLPSPSLDVNDIESGLDHCSKTKLFRLYERRSREFYLYSGMALLTAFILIPSVMVIYPEIALTILYFVLLISSGVIYSTGIFLSSQWIGLTLFGGFDIEYLVSNLFLNNNTSSSRQQRLLYRYQSRKQSSHKKDDDDGNGFEDSDGTEDSDFGAYFDRETGMIKRKRHPYKYYWGLGHLILGIALFFLGKAGINNTIDSFDHMMNSTSGGQNLLKKCLQILFAIVSFGFCYCKEKYFKEQPNGVNSVSSPYAV